MKIFNRLSRINIPNPLARLHVENQHANARQPIEHFWDWEMHQGLEFKQKLGLHRIKHKN